MNTSVTVSIWRGLPERMWLRALCLMLTGLLAGLLPPPVQAQRPQARAELPLPPPPTPPVPSPYGVGVRAAPRPEVPPQGAIRWGAIYAAQPPSAAFGASGGLPDRLMAHVRAEMQCRSGPGGDTCRRVLEVGQGCGALAHGARDMRFLPNQRPDPNQPVALAVGGSGPDVAGAERDALAICRQRERRATCRVVATVCATLGAR